MPLKSRGLFGPAAFLFHFRFCPFKAAPRLPRTLASNLTVARPTSRCIFFCAAPVVTESPGYAALQALGGVVMARGASQ